MSEARQHSLKWWFAATFFVALSLAVARMFAKLPWIETMFLAFQPFMFHPELIAVVATCFALGYVALRSSRRFQVRPLLMAAVVWGLWFPWEWHIRATKGNIRVDLILLGPLLFGITVWALVAACLKEPRPVAISDTENNSDPNTVTDSPGLTAPRRRWFQFRLRTLFVVMTFAALVALIAKDRYELTRLQNLLPPPPRVIAPIPPSRAAWPAEHATQFQRELQEVIERLDKQRDESLLECPPND